MKTIEGDLLDIDDGLICHQVNICGVFNAVLAKQIRIKYLSFLNVTTKDINQIYGHWEMCRQ
jgi:hypothetical protein